MDSVEANVDLLAVNEDAPWDSVEVDTVAVDTDDFELDVDVVETVGAFDDVDDPELVVVDLPVDVDSVHEFEGLVDGELVMLEDVLMLVVVDAVVVEVPNVVDVEELEDAFDVVDKVVLDGPAVELDGSDGFEPDPVVVDGVAVEVEPTVLV